MKKLSLLSVLIILLMSSCKSTNGAQYAPVVMQPPITITPDQNARITEEYLRFKLKETEIIRESTVNQTVYAYPVYPISGYPSAPVYPTGYSMQTNYYIK